MPSLADAWRREAEGRLHRTARAPQVPTSISLSTYCRPAKLPPAAIRNGPPSEPAMARSGTTCASARMMVSNTRYPTTPRAPQAAG